MSVSPEEALNPTPNERLLLHNLEYSIDEALRSKFNREPVSYEASFSGIRKHLLEKLLCRYRDEGWKVSTEYKNTPLGYQSYTPPIVALIRFEWDREEGSSVN